MKSKLKAPGTKRLKLKYDNLLSIIRFQIQLAPLHRGRDPHRAGGGQGRTLVPLSAQLELFCPPCNPT
jgi:hypothetical protein